MFRITYSSESADGRTKPDFTINDTASDWLWWWYRYFKENADYKAYCEARRNGDTAICSMLESRFERIAELYEDWGDIHLGKRLYKNESSWREWLFDRRHLFFINEPAVKTLSRSADVERGAIAIQIPAAVSKNDLLRVVTEFIEQNYADLRTTPKPKYELYAPEGRIDQRTFQTVKKSFYVHAAAQQHVWFPDSNAGTALEVMALELKTQLGFDWELEADQEERLRNGKLSMLELDSFKKQIARYKAQFDGYVANTIHGVFPKK
ncbi:hypothetical protein [Paraburkholderia sp. WP4_3_2]|nr:hypothetical protein [Paraburkholderia sp. WP4_3_2]